MLSASKPPTHLGWTRRGKWQSPTKRLPHDQNLIRWTPQAFLKYGSCASFHSDFRDPVTLKSEKKKTASIIFDTTGAIDRVYHERSLINVQTASLLVQVYIFLI